MRKILHKTHKTFIPHKDNDFIPHILTEVGILVSLFLLIIFSFYIFSISYFFRQTVLGVQMSADILVDRANETRLQSGQKPLTRNDKLDLAAEYKVDDMIQNKYFDHKSPEGLEAWDFIYKVGYAFKYAGENLAINFNNENDVHSAWLNSPTHRANLLDIKFREIGISAAEGIRNGFPTIFVVQIFATPAKKDFPKVVLVNKANAESIKEIEKKINGEVVTSTNTETKEQIKTLYEVENLKIVEDVNKEAVVGSNNIPKYSNLFERFLWDSTNILQRALAVFIFLVLLSTFLMLFIELERKHHKHIFYGFSLVLFMLLLFYILIINF